MQRKDQRTRGEKTERNMTQWVIVVVPGNHDDRRRTQGTSRQNIDSYPARRKSQALRYRCNCSIVLTSHIAVSGPT